MISEDERVGALAAVLWRDIPFTPPFRLPGRRLTFIFAAKLLAVERLAVLVRESRRERTPATSRWREEHQRDIKETNA